MRTFCTIACLVSLALPASTAWAGSDDADRASDDGWPTSGDGYAQDEDDDEDDGLDDILGTGDSVKEEVDAVRRGELGDKVGARNEDLLLIDDEAAQKRLIKTIQRKSFLKIARWEASPHVAFLANDPFLNRYIAGVGLGYHLTEVFEIEGTFDYSPDLGRADWKPLTEQIVEENQVSPDISKLTAFSSASFLFSPIYGKVAINGRRIVNFDIYGTFGLGIAYTADDLEALQATGESRAESTQFQIHPTTSYGGGLRIVFNENLAVRLESRSLVYVETINGTTLELKQNLLVQGGVSLFFPNMRR